MGGQGAGLETEDEPGASLPWKMAGWIIVESQKVCMPRSPEGSRAASRAVVKVHPGCTAGGGGCAGLPTSGKPRRMYRQDPDCLTPDAERQKIYTCHY